MIPPIIHLNGTGKETLEAEYETAWRAVKAARDAVGNITVHGRDYYVSDDPKALQKAQEARADMWRRLYTMADELQSVRIHLSQS